MNEAIAGKMFQDDLLEDERILWAGQPDPAVIFSKADVFLVPFSLAWGGIVIVSTTGLLFAKGISLDIPGLIRLVVALLSAVAGFYFIVGRFFYKAALKKKTCYAVTNKRVLVLATLVDRNLRAEFINAIPSISHAIRKDGIGTIVFGNRPAMGAYSNSGLDFFEGYYQPVLAFYDIRDARQVYDQVSRLRKGSH